MKHISSSPTLIFLFLNASLLLGIVYLWYPRISDVRGEVGVLSVHKEELDARNWKQKETVSVEKVVNEEKSVEKDPGYGLQATSSLITSTTDVQVISELAQTVNLSVPFTSQAPEGNWDQPWQDACEEAAILMLDAYYKEYNLSPLFSKDEMIKMVDWQTERGWGYSIPMVDVEKVSQWYMGASFQFTIIENPTVRDIQSSLASGHPVLVVAYGKSLGNPYFSGDGPEYHALIIRGYTEDQFITNDPGTKHGEGYVYDFDTLMNSIHDWNDGNVQDGTPVVLVVQ